MLSDFVLFCFVLPLFLYLSSFLQFQNRTSSNDVPMFFFVVLSRLKSLTKLNQGVPADKLMVE